MMAMTVSVKRSASSLAGPGGSLAKVFAVNIMRPSAGAFARIVRTGAAPQHAMYARILSAYTATWERMLGSLFGGLERELGRKAKGQQTGDDAPHRAGRKPQRGRGAVLQHRRQPQDDRGRKGAEESIGEA